MLKTIRFIYKVPLSYGITLFRFVKPFHVHISQSAHTFYDNKHFFFIFLFLIRHENKTYYFN